MLTPLPQLFTPQLIHANATLEHFAQLARRQQRRVKWGVIATAVVTVASAIPQLQGPGPLLTMAAKVWPSIFGGIYYWSETPTALWEIFASMGLLGVFFGICAAEWMKLKAFRAELLFVDMDPFERAVFEGEANPPPHAVHYIREVEKMRPLRAGDWKLALALLHRQFPDLAD